MMSWRRSGQNVLDDLTSVAYGFRNRVYLSNRAADNLSFTQRLKLVSRLDVHNGCVNTICWNDTGQYILSGSDDQHLVVVNPFTGKIEVSLHTAHRANIFSARFLPNCQDKQTVSCSADGLIHFYDFERPELINGFDCHLGAVYEVLTVPNDSYTFLSCGEDGTVRWFDLRTKTRCIKANCEEDVMINSRQAVMSLAINPMMPFQLAIGCADSMIRVYDRRQLSTGVTGADPSRSGAMLHCFSAPSVKKRNHRITSLAYSHDGEEILVSYSSEHLYLFNFKDNEGENQVPLVKSIKDLDEVSGASMDEGSAASDPSSSSDPTTSGEYVFRPCAGRQPPVKRLRLRGDWSDTGPNARPEREREPSQDETASSIMQRMSNMLTRLLEGRLRQGGNNEARSSNDAPADQESDERGEQDLSGETGGTDSSSSSVLTAESSLSSSDASSAAFVSCSASDREVSNEDSKDAFEMSECAPADRHSYETEERQTFRVCPGSVPDSDEGDAVADGRQFISGSQAASETALLETMPSLPGHSSSIAVTNSNEFATSIDLCAKGQGRDDGVVGAVVSEAVAEQLDGVSPNQKRLSRDKLVAEQPGNELLAVVNAACGQSSDQTEMKVEDETPVRLGTIPVSSRPAAGLVSACALQSDRLTERIPAAECAGTEQKIIGTSDVLLDQRAAEFSDMSCDGAVSLESYASFTSAQILSMQETVAEDSVLISTASSGADSLDGSGLDGREDEPKEEEGEASGSLGNVGQQEVSFSRLADDPVNANDSLRSSRSDRSDEDSDSEEAYTSPASRKAWLEQRLEEKNAAASKLQAVFRQHMEEKMKNREAGLLLHKPALRQCYLGHRNSRTMIKEASFWGQNYIMSGSDCGHIFIWDRQTAKLVMLLEGDRHVVNCLQPHPFHPILASSGIDYDVKIWMPANESPCFDYPRAAELMRRNEVMQEETKDTVTVPASFMLRMLLSLNHARRGGRLSGLSRERSSSDHNSSASSRDE